MLTSPQLAEKASTSLMYDGRGRSAFSGASVLFDGFIDTVIMVKKQPQKRRTAQGDLLDCHTKLPTKNAYGHYPISCKQVRGENKGRVSANFDIVVLENPFFKISEKGRLRVKAEQSKNVHAFVRGTLVAAYQGVFTPTSEMLTTSYNPYFAGYFFHRDSKKAVGEHELTRYAILQGSTVYLSDTLPT